MSFCQVNSSARDDALCSCGNLLNCVNWVSSFSNSIHSRYIRYLSVMQCPVILHLCVIAYLWFL